MDLKRTERNRAEVVTVTDSNSERHFLFIFMMPNDGTNPKRQVVPLETVKIIGAPPMHPCDKLTSPMRP